MCTTELECLQSLEGQVFNVYELVNGLEGSVSGTKQSVDDLAPLVASLQAKADQAVFLVECCALTLAFLWGAYTWRLIVLAKNQREIW